MNEALLAMSVATVAAAGLHLMFSRDNVSLILGMALIGSAANLFVFVAGGLNAVPPIIPDGMVAPIAPVADPLPQALVLTAIVIGFALACMGLALVLAIQKARGDTDADPLGASEPPARASGEPGVLP